MYLPISLGTIVVVVLVLWLLGVVFLRRQIRNRLLTSREHPAACRRKTRSDVVMELLRTGAQLMVRVVEALDELKLELLRARNELTFLVPEQICGRATEVQIARRRISQLLETINVNRNATRGGAPPPLNLDGLKVAAARADSTCRSGRYRRSDGQRSQWQVARIAPLPHHLKCAAKGMTAEMGWNGALFTAGSSPSLVLAPAQSLTINRIHTP